MLVRMFSGEASVIRSLAKSTAALEDEINRWLRANPGVEIRDIKQTSCGGSFDAAKTIVSLWYEDASESVG